MDFIGISLLILLGAAISNVLDTMFGFTPRLAAWLTGERDD
jgi:hypothetical protein